MFSDCVEAVITQHIVLFSDVSGGLSVLLSLFSVLKQTESPVI